MYHLLSGFVAHLTKKEEFSVLIMGLDAAGKTTFLERVKSVFSPSAYNPDLSAIAPTIGQNIGRVTLSSSVLQFWDLGGQRDIRGIWRKYYEEADGVCFVIDSGDKERMEESWEVFEQVVTDHRVEGVPVLVIANKSDLPDRLPLEEIKETFNRLVVGKLNVSEGAVMACSAVTGEGVREAVDWLFLRVQNSRDRRGR